MLTDDKNKMTGGNCAEAVSMKLEEDIKSQGLKKGEKLMPLRRLAERYGTSYPTMCKAIGLLTDKDVLFSRQGSGVYVAGGENPAPAKSTRQKLAVLYCGYEKYTIAQGVYSDLLYGIEQEAATCNVDLAVSVLPDLRDFTERDVYSGSDGFLLVGVDMPGLEDALKDKPAVWMLGVKKDWGDYISYDNRLVGVFAAEEMVSAGRKNLMCINVEAKIGDDRCRAFQEHAENLGAKVLYLNNPDAMIRTRHEQHLDYDALSGWVDRIERELPDLSGVFVVDLVAAPLYAMLKERGIQPGKDIEIATSNWRDYVVGGTQYQPTNILLHTEKVGAMALRQLLWRIKNPQAERFVMRIEPEVDKTSTYRSGSVQKAEAGSG